MKETFLDRFIGYWSPESQARRLRSRAQVETIKRIYDVSQEFNNSDWTKATKKGANEELKNAIAPGREKARALVQNAPYGDKAISVIVSETVGTGIIPNITGKNKSQTKLLNQLWRKWAETTVCDHEGLLNYYGLQELAMRNVVESGEALALKKFDVKTGPKIKIIESDHIVTDKDEKPFVQGVKLDEEGKRLGLEIYKSHPGEKDSSEETIFVPINEVAHCFRKKRAGQQRGITWAHTVIEKMKDFDDYQHATLIRQKNAACFSAVVTTEDSDSFVDEKELKSKREAEWELTPHTVRYLRKGEDIKLISPPGVDGYAEHNRETLRAAASGWGISYESLTGDYSQSNYSSSRMGQKQMEKNIHSWRWNMFIPMFCEPTSQWFLEWAKTKGVDISQVTIQWVPPASTYIDPAKEIAASKSEVRNGTKSWGEHVREQGRDPEIVAEEIAYWNKRFDSLGLVLDTDPRKMSQVGLVQSQDPNNIPDNSKDTSNNENQKDATSVADSSDDQ